MAQEDARCGSPQGNRLSSTQMHLYTRMHHRHTPPTSTIHEHTNDRPRAQALHQNGEDGLEAFLNKYQVTKHARPHTYHSSALPPATRPNPGLSFTQYASQPPLPTPCIYPYIYNAHGALLTQQAAEAIRICLLLYCGDGCRSMTTEKVRVNAIRSRRNQPICGHTHTHTHTHTSTYACSSTKRDCSPHSA